MGKHVFHHIGIVEGVAGIQEQAMVAGSLQDAHIHFLVEEFDRLVGPFAQFAVLFLFQHLSASIIRASVHDHIFELVARRLRQHVVHSLP